MSDLADWMEGIKKQGEEIRQNEEKQREYLLSQPHELFEEDDRLYAMWRGVNCVSVAQFFSLEKGKHGKLDIHSFTQYSYDFIDKMNAVQRTGKLVGPRKDKFYVAPNSEMDPEKWDVALNLDSGLFFVTASAEPNAENVAGPFDTEDIAWAFIQQAMEKNQDV